MSKQPFTSTFRDLYSARLVAPPSSEILNSVADVEKSKHHVWKVFMGKVWKEFMTLLCRFLWPKLSHIDTPNTGKYLNDLCVTRKEEKIQILVILIGCHKCLLNSLDYNLQ